MKRPSKDHAAKHNKKNLEIVDVVVHPELAKCLRPHQVEGVKVSRSGRLKLLGIQAVKRGPATDVLMHILTDRYVFKQFMYECVMGMRKTEGTGCILADEVRSLASFRRLLQSLSERLTELSDLLFHRWVSARLCKPSA